MATTSTPLVSTIIIFLNEAAFLEEAIESVFAQSYSNWELLLADDGSTDESTAIAKRYADRFPERVRYLEHAGHENRGMSATRNLGIREARGQYVAFLDGDDVWFPNKLERQVALMEQHPSAAMLYGRTQFWFDWLPNNPCRSLFYLEEDAPEPLTTASKAFDTLIEPPVQLLHHLKDSGIYPCSCSMFFRRSVFDEVGLFEEQFRNAQEDMVFHSKVFLKYPVYVSSECWDRYRIHPNSYWRTAWLAGEGRKAERQGRLNYLKWLESYLQEEGVTDPRVWKQLRRAWLPYRFPKLFRLLERGGFAIYFSILWYRRWKQKVRSAIIQTS